MGESGLFPSCYSTLPFLYSAIPLKHHIFILLVRIHLLNLYRPLPYRLPCELVSTLNGKMKPCSSGSEAKDGNTYWSKLILGLGGCVGAFRPPDRDGKKWNYFCELSPYLQEKAPICTLSRIVRPFFPWVRNRLARFFNPAGLSMGFG